MLDTAVRLLYTDRVSVESMLTRRIPFDEAPQAYRWLDAHPQGAVKMVLEYAEPGG
jgi:threonine dehydrogenase-like Zn-dependent dehydrogenase